MLPEITEMLANAGLAVPSGMIEAWWRDTNGKPRTREAASRVSTALKKRIRSFGVQDRKRAKAMLRHCERVMKADG